MTAGELILKQLANSEIQLLPAISGLDAKHDEAKATAGGMSIRTTFQRLTEASLATLANYERREHS